MSGVKVIDISKMNFTLFLSMIKNEDCWTWVGKTKNGFGQLVIEGLVKSASHYAYEFFNGKLQPNFLLIQTCGNTLCCNHKHMKTQEIFLPPGNWKPAPDLPFHFMVSDNGELFSARTKKIAQVTLTYNGYASLTTRLNGRNSPSKFLRLHVQVAKAFVPNQNNKPYVNHINCIKTSNFMDNLEWVTHKENMQHANSNGLVNYNKIKYKTILSIAQVKEILDLTHLSARKIAKMFKVSRSVIDKIRKNPTKYLEIAGRK